MRSAGWRSTIHFSIDLRWNTRISLEVGTIFAYRRAEKYENILLVGLAVIVPLFLLTLFLAIRLRAAKKRPKRPAAPRASSWPT